MFNAQSASLTKAAGCVRHAAKGMLNRQSGWRVAVPALLLGLAVSVAAATEPLRREYFVRQGDAEALLIRIDGHEAEFRAAVFTIGDEAVATAGVPGQRSAPLFLYVPETTRPRQLDIQVTATRHTDRSRFEMALYRIGVHDQRSARLDQAYRLLALGLQPPESDTEASWSVKLSGLSSARGVFAGFGMDELRLWASCYQAWLTLTGLGDVATAAELAENALADPSSRRYPEIALALAQVRLEAAKLASDPAALQSAVDDVLRRAEVLDRPLARAEALFASAEAYTQAGARDEALARYRSALEIADAIGANDLSTSILKQLPATGDVLRDIESRLGGSDTGDELARNLLAQGRLLNRARRFPEATDVLTQALSRQHNSATLAQIQLELARAAWETGRPDETLERAMAAVWLPGAQAWRRPTTLLDVGAGLGLIASAHRVRGEAEPMRRARSAQAAYLESVRDRRRYEYARGLDLLAFPADTAEALGIFRRLATDSDGVIADLARLQACAASGACRTTDARQALEAVRRSGTLRQAAEAQYRHALALRRGGDDAAALDVFSGLADEIRFLQETLPGVLGAWYWQRRDAVLDDHAALLMRTARPDQALLGLVGARAVARAEGRSGAAGTKASREAVRDALAEAASGDGDIAAVNEQVDALRAEWRQYQDPYTPSDLRDWLNALGADAAVVDFHIGERGAWALLGRRDGVRRFRLTDAGGRNAEIGDTAARLGVLTGSAFDAAAARLGEWLLADIGDALPRRLYWIGAGPLARVPPAALRRSGRYLAESHEFVEPVGFPAAVPEKGVCAASSPRVFLAGAPGDYSADYLVRLEPAVELRAVTERFVGPQLTVVQGSALLADEFATEAFRTAGRVHLAMPALIDFARPPRSWIELSEPGRGQGRQRPGPEAVAAWALDAGSVFLSQARFEGEPGSGYHHGPPLVTELMAAGAECVVASAWPQAGEAVLPFITSFYEGLASGRDLPAALAAAQRAGIEAGGEDRDWARYRLFAK